MTLTADEVEVLRATVRDFLDRLHPVHGARDASSDTRARMWEGMANELGLSGLCIAETHGGVGEERAARRMVLEELGRALVPGPAFSTLAVASVIAAAGDAAAARHLPDIASGHLTAGFSMSSGASAVPDGNDGWRLDGTVRHVVEGTDAGLILVLATATNASGAFLLDARAEGISAMPVEATDPTRPLASLSLSGVRATALAGMDAQRAAALIARDLAFEQLGGARWCLETTRDFAAIRTQFGRTIGSFQAVKHLLADVVLENEAAWAAATGIDDQTRGEPGLEVLAGSVVHTLASEAYLRAAGTAVQVHGAIAITDETDVHLHFKRATTTRQMLGGMSTHYDRVLEAVLALS